MAPHFLSLPGEIRNRIYDLVFAEENGVSYHEDLNGVGWLCVYNEKEDSDRLGVFAKEDQDDAFDRELSQSTHYHNVEDDNEDDLVLEEFLATIEDNVEEYMENYDHYIYDSEEDNEDGSDDSDDSDGSGGSEDDSDVTEDEDQNIEENSDIFGAIRNIITDRRIKAKARAENIKDYENANLEDYVELKTELNDSASDDHPLRPQPNSM